MGDSTTTTDADGGDEARRVNEKRPSTLTPQQHPVAGAALSSLVYISQCTVGIYRRGGGGFHSSKKARKYIKNETKSSHKMRKNT